jgi:hypothetical protein
MPAFFPFLLVAAAVIAIGSGSKAGWRTQAQMADGEHGAPPSVQGMPTKRWFFWYVLPIGASQYGTRGPSYLTDAEAFDLEASTKSATLGVQLFRFVYLPLRQVWVYDTRNEPALLASREIRDANGNVVGVHHRNTGACPDFVGAIALTTPLKGPWPYTTLPAQVRLNGKLFKKARFSTMKTGVVGQYREAVSTNSMHLYVMANGTYLVTHLDEANPDMGRALEHLFKDVIRPMQVA